MAIRYWVSLCLLDMLQVCNEIRYSLIGNLTADVHFAGTSSASADATVTSSLLSLSGFQREAELIMLMSLDHLVINFDQRRQ